MSKAPARNLKGEAIAAVEHPPADSEQALTADPPEDVLSPTEDEEPPPPLPSPSPAPVAHKAVVEVPSTTVAEVKSLLPADGGSMATVLLAAIGVLGGGAGWKFYQNFAKQRHEQRMKQLEIEATRVEKVEAVKAEIAAENAEARREQKDDSHQKCSVERAALEAKVVTLESRLAEAERAAQEAVEAARAASDAAKQDKSDLPSFDVEDFEGVKERIEQLEKALKKAPSEKKSKSKKDAKDKS